MTKPDTQPVERHVVTCFLESDGDILLLRRSQQVGSYRGRWAGVSGYIESTPDVQALIEIEEETGLTPEDVEMLHKGEPLPVEDPELGVRWIVHPYLFRIGDRDKVRTDWEHTETKWVRPEDIGELDTVPKLREAMARVHPPGTNN